MTNLASITALVLAACDKAVPDSLTWAWFAAWAAKNWAVSEVAALYAHPDALIAKRAACMERDFSWATRKAEYLEVYRGAV